MTITKVHVNLVYLSQKLCLTEATFFESCIINETKNAISVSKKEVFTMKYLVVDTALSFLSHVSYIFNIK